MPYVKNILQESGILNEGDAKAFGLCTATYYRAKNKKINKHLLHTLKLRAGQGNNWKGIKIRDGHLITPDGHHITANEILSIEYGKRLAYEAGYENARQNQQIAMWGHHNEAPAHTKLDS